MAVSVAATIPRMTDQTSSISASDFDAAKTVFDALKDLQKPAQERVLRWVAESLGVSIQPPGATQTPPITAARTPTPPEDTTLPGPPTDVSTDTGLDILSF